MAKPEPGKPPRPKPTVLLAPLRPTDSEPVPKVLHDLVTVEHKLREERLNHETIMAALRAHKAKRDQSKTSMPKVDVDDYG